MSQVTVDGTEQGKKAARVRAPKAEKPAEPVKATVDSTVQEIVSGAATAHEARLAIGRAVIIAQRDGVALLDIAKRLLMLTGRERHNVNAVVSLKTDNGAKSALSKLATIASVFADGFKSPDGNHVVTAAQCEAWALSVEDSVTLARRIKSKDNPANVKTLAGYVKDADGGAKRVREYLDSTKPASSTGGKKALLGIEKRNYDVFLERAKAADMSADEYLAVLLAKK